MIALIFSAVILLIYYVYHIINNTTSYWSKKGINGPKPHPIFGNFRTWLWTGEESLHSVLDGIYNECSGEQVIGVYFLAMTPALVIRDPEIIKTVLIKDFTSFTDRGARIGDDPITKSVFFTDGDEWRILRQKLTPIFSTGKLKGMIPLINSCSDHLIQHVDNLIHKDTNSPIDIHVVMSKYTLKSIMSIAFGIDVHIFEEQPTEFEKMTKNFFASSKRRKIHYFLQERNRDFVNLFKVKFHPTDVVNFFKKLITEIIQERVGKPKVRNDFIDCLIELREQGTFTTEKDGGFVEFEISDDVIVAQSMSFIGAGFETTAGTLSYLLYELAHNPDVQSRCCEEIDTVMEKYNGQLNYDSLKELKYLSMALDETLRKYPVAATVFRVCVEDYTFKDLNLTIKKGTRMLIPALALQRDPKYYPDPDKFDPERFSAQNKEKGNECYLAFGAGPRSCLAFRFALMQSTICMAKFLHRFKVATCEKTPEKIIFNPKSFSLSPSKKLWLNIERRNTKIY